LVTHLRAIRGDIKITGSLVNDTCKNKTIVPSFEISNNNNIPNVKNKRTFDELLYGLTSTFYSDVAESLISSETEEDIMKVTISNKNVEHYTDSGDSSRCSTPEETFIEN
jgi:hypothetical protein